MDFTACNVKKNQDGERTSDGKPRATTHEANLTVSQMVPITTMKGRKGKRTNPTLLWETICDLFVLRLKTELETNTVFYLQQELAIQQLFYVHRRVE